MELRHLRYLATVVDERSVSRAADRLGMTQPPLSSAIQQVEREVGTPLLVRHARGVEPTEAGRYLAEEVRHLLDHLDDAVSRARAVGEGRVGRLSIAAEPVASWGWLPAVVGLFASRSSEVTLDVTATSPAAVVGAVRSEQAAVGMVYAADANVLANSTAGGLQTAVARREQLLVALPPGHRLAGSAVVDLADLAHDAWVLPRRTPSVPAVAEILAAAWAEVGAATPSPGATATTAEALALVAAGGRVAVLPSSVRAVVPGGVHLALPRRPLGELEAVVVWRDGTPSAALREFLSAALRTPEPDQLGAHLARPLPDDGDAPSAGW